MNDGVIAQELLLTAWRIPFAALYLWLSWRTLLALKAFSLRVPRNPLIVAAIMLALASDALAASAGGLSIAERAVFILTTTVVALREELIYRVVLQTTLERRFGPDLAIVVSTIVFILFHIGMQPMNILTISSLAVFGVVAGTLYLRTRSLALVVAFHFVADVAVLILQTGLWLPEFAFVANVTAIVFALVWCSWDGR